MSSMTWTDGRWARWSWLPFGPGLLLPLASLSWFSIGYWGRAEPLVIGLHGCGALAALVLSLCGWQHPARLRAALRHPLVLLPLLLGLFSAAVAPWSGLPIRSLLGAPQSGHGALWYFDLAMLVALASLVAAHPLLWHRLTTAAVIICGWVAALKGWDWGGEASGWPHLLIWVAAYYAWLVPPLAVLLASGKEGWNPLRLAGVVVILALTVVSRSLTAAIAVTAGAVGWWLAAHGLQRGWSEKWMRRGGAGMALALVILPIVCEFFIPATHALASLDDRYRLLRMLWRSWAGGDWPQWVLGTGWGRIGDTFQSHLQASGQNLWDGQWIFLQSDYFHAHNGLFEAFHAVGAPGTLLTLFLIAAPPLLASRERLAPAVGYAVAVGALAGLWFPLPLSIPLTGLALGYLAAPVTTPMVVSVERSRSAVWAVLGIAMVLAGAAGVEWFQARTFSTFQRDLSRGEMAAEGCPITPGGDDLALAEIFRDTLLNALEITAPEERQRRIKPIRVMLECLERRIPVTPTPLLVITGLSLIEQIQFTGRLEWAAETLPTPDPWAKWLNRALTLAPERTDLAIPFLTREIVAGRQSSVHPWVETFLQRNPDDAVGLYFMGILQTQAGATAQGMELLRRAIDRGIERFMPLDERIRDLVAAGKENTR